MAASGLGVEGTGAAADVGAGAVGTDFASAVCGTDTAICADDMLGELVELVLDWFASEEMPTAGCALGGGGKGAIPTLFLSAAAAAADAYFSPSPGGLVGTIAGFMPLLFDVGPLLIVGKDGVASVARVGSGDLSWDDVLRLVEDVGASVDVRSFPLARLAALPSGSSSSSCTD